MDHSCYKCAATIEDGTAFCPQCAAPQIRVGVVEPVSQEVFSSEIDHSSPVALPGRIQWSQALPSAAIAGFVAAVIMLIPLGAFGLGMLAAGTLSVLLYHRRNPGALLTPGMGARLGAASGALGFGIFAIFTSASMLIFHSGGQFRVALLDAIQQSVARNSDPQAQEILEFFKTPAGLAWMMGFVFLVMFVAFLIFSSLGGAIGAALLGRKHRQ